MMMGMMEVVEMLSAGVESDEASVELIVVPCIGSSPSCVISVAAVAVAIDASIPAVAVAIDASVPAVAGGTVVALL
jgi:hypothetical protein